MSSTGEARVRVRLPGVLCDLFPGAPRSLEVEAATGGEMIDALEALFPGMGHRIRDERPAVRRHINIFVDGERSQLETHVSPGTEIFIFTAISGG